MSSRWILISSLLRRLQKDIRIEKDNEYALQLSIYCQSLKKAPCPRPLNAVPSSLVDRNHLHNDENYDRLLLNRQYSLLNQLDHSIDFNRFSVDAEYRRQTILGLFMCENPVLDSAEQLAIQNNLSIDECHQTYLEYLLTNSDLPLNEIRKRIKPFLTSERMKKNRQVILDLVKRLHTNVFPLIAGNDIERLKLFYDMKKSLGDTTHAHRHIQAIQQLSSILHRDFDYKLFLSTPELFVAKYCNDSNLVPIALAVDQVKLASSLLMDSFSIYSSYVKTNPSSSILFDLFTRMESDERFPSLIDQLTSTESGLALDRRIAILEYFHANSHRHHTQVESSVAVKLRERLVRLAVLSQLSSNYSDEQLNLLDQCQHTEQQEELLATLLLEHGHVRSILLVKNQLFESISLRRILTMAITELSNKLKLGQEQSYSTLNELLEHLSSETMDEKELLSCLQDLCREETIDRRVRFQLIDKLDRVRCHRHSCRKEREMGVFSRCLTRPIWARMTFSCSNNIVCQHFSRHSIHSNRYRRVNQ